MNEGTRKRVKNLPTWAKDMVADLERQNEKLQETIDILAKNIPDSNIKVHTNIGASAHLPNDSRIVFEFGQEEISVAVLNIHDGPAVLAVYSSRSLLVKPQAANHIQIKAGQYGDTF